MIACPYCKSKEKVVKSGYRYNASGKKQRYQCNTCLRLFVPHDAFWKMKNRPEVIAEALSCKKRGMSYEEVSKHFKEYDKANFTSVSVLNWAKKYGSSLDGFNKKQNPRLSGKFSNDEFVFKVKKKEMLSMGVQRQKNKVQDKHFIFEKQKLRKRG